MNFLLSRYAVSHDYISNSIETDNDPCWCESVWLSRPFRQYDEFLKHRHLHHWLSRNVLFPNDGDSDEEVNNFCNRRLFIGILLTAYARMNTNS